MTATTLETFLDIAQRLLDHLDMENDALRRHDREFMPAHVEDKLRLCKAYEKLYRTLTADPKQLAKMPEEEREALRRTGQRLDAALKENGVLLEVAIRSRQILVDLIAEAARTSRTGPGTYSKNGQVGKADPRGRGKASLAIDKSY